MAVSRTCDGIKRRDFLKVGALGAGLSLSGYLRVASAAEVSGAKAKNAIKGWALFAGIGFEICAVGCVAVAVAQVL